MEQTTTETGVKDVVVAEQQSGEIKPQEVKVEPQVPTEPAKTVDVATQPVEPVPQSNAPSAAWAEMRRKAKEADELAKTVKDYEMKLDKLAKQLPDGYSSVDEYLESLESDFGTKKDAGVAPTDVNIESIVKKAIAELPEIKQIKTERQNYALVESFKEAQRVFPDIKSPENIPLEVYDAWNEGASGRTLVSHLKEYRYDQDIAFAKQQAQAQAKQQAMGVSHVSQVQGTQTTVDTDDVTIDPATEKSLREAGIPREKWKIYYKKYHR